MKICITRCSFCDIFIFLRKDAAFLSKGRIQVLTENEDELERRINIQSGELLAYLVKKKVMTEVDKEMIMV